ncbi:hypothetical protein MKW98_020234 [Papaver atlanticum]|uniref:CBM20 domain-containing protein n=1 Tax=Papaver atlanticum TaxID=357466 RepID=A0AAD4XA19_9MAGN|nr:hypothetical protein MKW98_020234 [Papaver atlanticum]
MSCNSSSPHPLLLQSSKNRAFSYSSSRSAALLSTKKPQFVSFHHKLNYSNFDISHSSSLEFEAISSFSCKSSFYESSFSNAGKTEIPSQGKLQLKTVRVKFQLIKMCQFGQEILVVGDDPIFGDWDPSGAIPLKWSQGHFWTTELDLPISKTFHIKFILKDLSGEIIWQPGPSRFFLTLETNNKIVVTGDWNAVGIHMTTEKEPLPNSNTREPIAYPISNVVKMSHPEEGQNVAGDGVTSTGSFATEKNSASLRDEDTLLERKAAEPVPVPRSIALLIVIVKEGLPPVFNSSNNIKRAAAESKSNANGVEAAAKDNNKSEAITQNQKKEEPGKPDKEQVGVGDDKDCQSTNVDLSQWTDEELERLSRIHFGGSFSRDFLEDLGFDPNEFESTSDEE